MNFKWIIFAITFFVALFITQANATDLTALYIEDQAVRSHLRTLPENEVRKYITEVMLPGDKVRMAQVETILASNIALSSEEYFAAAMIMQHGSQPSHYQKAMTLSQTSAQLDPSNKKARWLSCAAEDRYRMKIGQSQVWGTQLSRKMNQTETYEIYYLENFDKTAKPDVDRIKCGLPALTDIEARLDKMAKIEGRSKQYKLWKTGSL
jgi:hypothetical protein